VALRHPTSLLYRVYIMYIMYRVYDGRVDDEVSVTDARAQFSELINRVGYGKERIILTRHGKPLVALLPAEAVTEQAATDQDPATVLDLSSQSTNYPESLGIAANSPTRPQA
jgi:prevent-host-death family protein